ncbi:MAG: hypothetical protein ACI4PR_01755 [Acutalibacteraceae bacterium]
MKSLLWKRLIEIQNNKIRLAFSLLISTLVLFLSIFVFKNNFDIVFAYFPMTTMAINQIFLASMDDILFCETLISTNISLKKMWWFNLIFVGIGNYIISTTLIVICSLLLGVFPGYLYLVQNILSFILSVSVLGCATIHYANYSKINQCIGTVFGLTFMIIPFVFVKFISLLPVSYLSLSISALISIILTVLAYSFMAHSSKEKMLINTAKLSNMMNGYISKE